MTAQKTRAPGTHEDAMTMVIGAFGGAKRAGEIIGVGRSRVYAAMDRDALNHSTLNFDQMVKLGAEYVRITGKPSPFISAMSASVAELVGVDFGPCMTPLERVGLVSSEINDVVQSIVSAVSPDSEGGTAETPRESREIVRQIDEAIAELNRHRDHYMKITANVGPPGTIAVLGQREAS